MGRYVTSVASTTVVLIEDTPDIVQQSVLGSIKNNGNIATDLMNTLTNTYAQKVRSAYNYARDKYVYGLPEGTIGRIGVNEEDILKALDTVYPLTDPTHKLQIISASIDEYNPENITKYFLQNGYVTSGFTLRYDPQTDIVHVEHSGGIQATYVRTDRLTAHSLTTTWDISRRTVSVAVNSINYFQFHTDKFYYYVKYIEVDKDNNQIGKMKYWVYQEDMNLFPDLNLSNQELITNQYMPVIPLRIANNTLYDTDKEKETEEYKTSKRLLTLLDLQIDELTDAINDNPDVDKVDHAYVFLGVNLYTNKPEALKYIYEFIKYIHSNDADHGNIIIKDETYHTRLRWDSLTFNVVNGSIGKVGTYRKTINTSALIMEYQHDIDTIHQFIWTNIALYNYIYQTSDTVITALDAHNQEDEALCIPINIDLIESTLTPLEANTVYYDALRIVFNSFERKKLKWYQTGIFKIVTIVIAVAITAISGGGLAGVAIALVSGLAINLVIATLVDLSIKIFGDKVGKIVASVLTIAAIVVGFATGFIPDLTTLLQIGIQVGTQVINEFTSIELADIANQSREFQTYAESKQDILEEAQSTLDNNVIIDPLGVFSSVGMIPRQTIDEYFYTKLELPLQAGEVSINMVDSWIDTQLTLPNF